MTARKRGGPGVHQRVMAQKVDGGREGHVLLKSPITLEYTIEGRRAGREGEGGPVGMRMGMLRWSTMLTSVVLRRRLRRQE
eukprot:28192-Eustigmatos_ZCMA.PRE.1